MLDSYAAHIRKEAAMAKQFLDQQRLTLVPITDRVALGLIDGAKTSIIDLLMGRVFWKGRIRNAVKELGHSLSLIQSVPSLSSSFGFYDPDPHVSCDTEMVKTLNPLEITAYLMHELTHAVFHEVCREIYQFSCTELAQSILVSRRFYWEWIVANEAMAFWNEACVYHHSGIAITYEHVDKHPLNEALALVRDPNREQLEFVRAICSYVNVSVARMSYFDGEEPMLAQIRPIGIRGPCRGMILEASDACQEFLDPLLDAIWALEERGEVLYQEA